MATEKTVKAFRDYVKNMTHYEEALALLEWDERTGAPRKGAELRAETIGALSSHLHQLSTSDEMAGFLDELSSPDVYPTLDSVTQAMVREAKREFEQNRRIPPDRHHAFVVLTSMAATVWASAKQASDFALFQPYLEQIVEMKNEFIDYWGYAEDRYDTLLDKYEPGLTVKQVDALFAVLRQEGTRLLQAIACSGRHADVSVVRQHFEIDKQRALSRRMLELIGYEFDAGRLDETVHPFMTTINRYDNRVTTKYELDDLRPGLFGTIHEGGHALYEQGISDELTGTNLATGTSMGIHESQSRFYENILGRSFGFWEGFYSEVARLFPAQLGGVGVEQFYRAVNDVRPSFIRIEADELTYNLHIILRYEIEKRLIHGDVKVKDLPEVWRSYSNELLGITPEKDADGVLQDIHWACGDFGYFPTYALGNIYAAQFYHAMRAELPDFDHQIRKGELQSVKQWLNRHIHCHGKMLQPAEIVHKVTGRAVDAMYLVDYLNGKFRPLYGL